MFNTDQSSNRSDVNVTFNASVLNKLKYQSNTEIVPNSFLWYILGICVSVKIQYTTKFRKQTNKKEIDLSFNVLQLLVYRCKKKWYTPCVISFNVKNVKLMLK